MAELKKRETQESYTLAKRIQQNLGGYVETILAAIGDEFGFFKDLASNGPGTCMQ